ncbi:hypothetical protein Bca52824_054575 [Brassica carinata]|uniref:XRI1 n=1 Tax=Brassica carinata TaxID=52824 RepID=A0A8X7R7L8_BRACI|nr:hypothetical protein Bca52824_054575 [Brassica carinata]
MSELLYSLPTWDLHNLGSLFKPDFNPDACGYINGSPQHIYRSPEMDYSDVSTGYLEDALIESCERSKRRRLLFEDPSKSLNDGYLSQNDWGLHESYGCLESQFVTPPVITDERTKGKRSLEEPIMTESPDFSVSPDKISLREKSKTEPSSSNCSNKNKILVYPFGLVKPGGREEDITLNDVNKRILMPPARPVRHPVGDFASRPCISTHGPGLSGKTVVALTRIQTQGRGTITIIRTTG